MDAATSFVAMPPVPHWPPDDAPMTLKPTCSREKLYEDPGLSRMGPSQNYSTVYNICILPEKL